MKGAPAMVLSTVRVSPKMRHKRLTQERHFVMTEKHGRVPLKVLLDRALTPYQFRVYVALCWLERDGGHVTCGVREIAKTAGVSSATTARAVQVLQDHGHLEIYVSGRGERQHYQLDWVGKWVEPKE